MSRDEIQREIDSLIRRIENKKKTRKGPHTMIENLGEALDSLDNEISDLEIELATMRKKLRTAGGESRSGNGVKVTVKRKRI